MTQTNTIAPRISIIMVDGGFRPSYHAIDYFCTQTFPQDDYELLWVEYTDKIHPQLAETVARYPNARVITLNQTGDYHPALCFNAGIEAARGELLVIPDADQACERDVLGRVWDEHQADDKLVMYLFRYEESQDDHVEPITLDTLAHLKRVGTMQSPSNFGACLTIRKKWLIEVNGYDRFWPFRTGYHAHGLDLNVRFKNLGLHIMWHPTIRLYHSWHPNTKLAANLIYGRQRIVSDWRAITQCTTTFDGLDAAKNVAVPDEITQKITSFEGRQARREAKKAARENGSLYAIKNKPPKSEGDGITVKRVLRKVMGRG